MTRRALIADRVRESIAVKELLLADDDALRTLARIAEVLVLCYRNGGKMIIFGNGGSAADAQHIAAELLGWFTVKARPALPATAITVNTSALTAIGNDYDFTDVFARQIEAEGRAGDVAIAISTSGRSPNVLAGLAMARKRGLVTVALTGRKGGRLPGAADYCLRIPSDDTPRIQECHILVGHILCELIEQALFGTAVLEVSNGK